MRLENYIAKAPVPESLKSEFIKEIKARVNEHGKDVIPFYLNKIKEFEEFHHTTLRGVSEKSLYAIASGTRKISRKRRSDAGAYKNATVIESLPKILALAQKYFFSSANENYLLTRDMVIAHARNDEEFWEVASITPSTLYNVIRAEGISAGWSDVHIYKNHFNNWDAHRSYVTGAFTDDVNFGDFIIGDDHKNDVHQIANYIREKGKIELAKPYTWSWNEGLTQNVEALIIKPTPLNVEDLKLSLLQALANFGKPVKGILTDNGIAKSPEFVAFCKRLKIPLYFARAYRATGKVTIERSFKYIKEEHDVFCNNYTGSSHAIEGRHPGLSLTPEQSDYLFETFKDSLLNYINNFYQTRPRNKIIKGKKYNLSIRELYDQFWKEYKMTPISPEEMRYAYMKPDDTAKAFKNKLIFKGEQYMPNEYITPVFNSFRYMVAYNPNDLSAIDLYAVNDIRCKNTGLEILKGEFVMTCYCTRHLANKMEVVKRYNNQRVKAIKQLAEAQLDVCIANNPHLTNNLNSTVGSEGRVHDVRKSALQKVTDLVATQLDQSKVKQIIEVAASPAADYNNLDFENDTLNSTIKSTAADDDIFDDVNI